MGKLSLAIRDVVAGCVYGIAFAIGSFVVIASVTQTVAVGWDSLAQSGVTASGAWGDDSGYSGPGDYSDYEPRDEAPCQGVNGPLAEGTLVCHAPCTGCPPVPCYCDGLGGMQCP